MISDLVFDNRGKATITLEGIAEIRLERTWGLQIAGKNGSTKTHFVDYTLENMLGVQKGGFFSYAPAFHNIYESALNMAVMPGINRLGLAAYPMERPEEKKHFHYEFNIDGRLYETNGVTFVMEGFTKDFSNAFLDRMAELALLIEEKTRKLVMTNGGYSMPRTDTRHGNVIFIGCRGTSEKKTESSIAHEKAHQHFDTIASNDFTAFYNRNMCDYKFGIPYYKQRIAGEKVVKYDPNCLFGIFSERNYEGHEQSAGHPWDGDTELFASATAILRVDEVPFFRKVSELEPEKKDLAREVASRVVGLYYGKAERLFSREVMNYASRSLVK